MCSSGSLRQARAHPGPGACHEGCQAAAARRDVGAGGRGGRDRRRRLLQPHLRPGAAARRLGRARAAAPFSVDMLIVVGELMLLHEADQHGNRFWLGWVLVSSGIAATMAANLAYGARYGITGALIWGWPAYSFVLVAAGMISVMKRAARRQGSAPPGAVPSPVPSDAENAALMALRATVAAGNPLSQNQLMERFGLTRAQATKARQQVTAQANGHQPPKE